ncbi:MAG: TIGR03790 family protein [Myxococcota bacterium]|nr:TIGR03790 family protein [Myxococcota bacterium]
MSASRSCPARQRWSDYRLLLAGLLLLSACPQPADDDDSAGTDDDDSASADDDDDSAPAPFDWSDRVLVLYNADEAESAALAAHYADRRGLGEDALCPTWPGAIDVVSPSVYSAGIAQPLLDCIAGDWDRYLVLVTTWGMPYRVTEAVRDLTDPTSVVPASVDALLTFPHHHEDLPLQPSWNPYFHEGESLVGSYEEGLSIAEWREQTGTTYYLVGRIDGPSPTVARRLVDDALAFEGEAPSGSAWVDRGWQERGEDSFGSYASVEWDLTRLVQIFEAAGFTTSYDEHPEEVGTAPAPESAEDVLYYGGWYSFNNYNDVWGWNPGAISLHFDSCSACDPRGGPNWSANVLERGAVATMGAVAEPYVAGLMHYDQFFRYLFQGHSFIEAASMSTPVTEWMAVFLGDPLYRPYGASPLLEPDWQPPELPEPEGDR